MFLVSGIILIIIGILMFCFPNIVYSITELWKSDYSGKPSGAYKVHIRIRSIFILFMGIFFIAVKLIYNL